MANGRYGAEVEDQKSEFNTFGGVKSNHIKKEQDDYRQNKKVIEPLINEDVLQMLALQAKAIENLIR